MHDDAIYTGGHAMPTFPLDGTRRSRSSSCCEGMLFSLFLGWQIFAGCTLRLRRSIEVQAVWWSGRRRRSTTFLFVRAFVRNHIPRLLERRLVGLVDDPERLVVEKVQVHLRTLHPIQHRFNVGLVHLQCNNNLFTETDSATNRESITILRRWTPNRT